MNLTKLYQKSLFLPLAIIFTYLCLFLETVKYPGFIGNHFFIDSKIYFTVVILLILFINTKTGVLQLMLKINRIFLLVITFVYLIFSLLEGLHFTNYVLATFHFHLDGLIFPVIFSLFIYLADKFKNEIPKVEGKRGLLYITLVSLIVFVLAKNAIYTAHEGVKRSSYVLFHLSDSYDQRMFYQWGIFYQFMVFVRNNTPDNANIVIPPEQDPWLMGSGNNDFVRAFLFPRKIIQEPMIIPDIKNFGPDTYILITWGKEACKPEGCHGWPRQDIKASEIIYKDPQSSNVAETRKNSVYKLEDDKYVYGLIKL